MNPRTRVLLVEDDPEIIALLKARLAYEDIDLRVIDRNFQDISAASFAGIDLLILDLWLTARGFTEGYPEAHRILQVSKAADRLRPVIVFSGVLNLHPDSTVETLADAVVMKHDLRDLVSTIASLTGMKIRGQE